MDKLERDIAEHPDDADIRAALDRVVASSHFSKSPQLGNFLRFVVDETLAGRAERIKAYSIASDAFGRDANFDPQNDPIVRVEACRLRRALGDYYTDGGYNDPIVIDLPRGHYVPVFRKNSARRRAVDFMRELHRQAAETLREKLRLVLMITVIAVTVCLTVEVLEKTVWPSVKNAVWSAAPEL